MSEPTYRAVLRVMLTDPEGEWYGLDLAEAAGFGPGWGHAVLTQMVELGWIENLGNRALARYRLTARGRKRAKELVA